MSSKKIIYIVLNILCPIILSFFILLYNDGVFSRGIIFLLIFISVLLLVLTLFLLKKRKNMLSKILLVINLFLTIFLSGYLVLKYYNYLSIFTSVASFKNFILSTGEKGVFIYILIQLLQVVLIPVPATIIALAGAIIYGPFLGALYCSLGVLLGSFTSFFLGRVFGFKLVAWIVGKDSATKYANIINNRGKLFLPIAFLLPLFPDDILCWIAGITTMNIGYYSFVTILTRPIGVICMCYFGGGYIIPFSGWGLYVWSVLAVVLVAVVILMYKYQPKMEEWILSKLKRKNKKKGG